MHLKLLGIKRPNNNHPDGDSRLALVLFLGLIEFSLAAITILLIGKDPKNSFLLGYSLARFILFLVTIGTGITMLLLAIKAYQGKRSKILPMLRKVFSWTDLNFLLFLTGCLAALVEPAMLGGFQYGFERLRPLLLVVCFLPIQFSLVFIHKVHWRFERSLWMPISLGFLSLLLLVGFIVLTKLGIAPDKVFWNVAGMPLSMAQLVIIFISVVIILEVFLIIKRFFPTLPIKYIDLGICILLFGSAVFIWINTPFTGHFFTNISEPLNQPFPFSDARGLDTGALSILLGRGINFNEQTVSPLYEVFLSILHGIAGYDYNLITRIQLVFLAILPMILYLFGKGFNNRPVGLLISIIVIVRQSNAILLSRMIAGSNPYLLTTEMPTYLTLLVFTGLVFWWMKKKHETPWIPFLSGAVLGMASLIRVNPIILFPTIPVIVLASMWKTKKKWLIQSTAFLIGFLLLIIPWVFTGTNEDGQSFFLQKFYNVIENRYDSSGQVPNHYDKTQGELLSSTRVRMRITLGDYHDVTIIDINHFPGFVVNHYLHNIVTSFLGLPDSISPSDQIVQDLALRPYWVEEEPWEGELQVGQKVFLVINILLLSMGIGWSWKRWHWAGLLPLFVFLVYLISMGFARVSGSRYIVPVDWVVFFYYVIGLTLIFGWVAKVFRLKIQPELETNESEVEPSIPGKRNMWYVAPTLIFLLAISVSIPIADNVIPANNLLCQDDSVLNSAKLVYKGNPQEVKFLIGRMLYPSIKNQTLTFTFLTCHGLYEMNIENFNNKISSGQLIVMVLDYPLGAGNAEMMLSVENGSPMVMWERR